MKKLILPKLKSNDFFSYSLYYYPFDDLLKDVIVPFLEKEKIETFFFIKFFEEGPHVRLRLNGPNKTEKSLYEKLKFYFEAYSKKNPTNKDLFQKHYKEAFNPKWKFDKIEKMAYQSEKERYGGNEDTMTLFEEQFQVSSKNILNFLVDNNDMTYSNKLGYALKSGISLIKSTGLSLF